MPTQAQDIAGGVALFIDWDNLAIGLRESGSAPNEKALSKFAQRYGPLLIARAYANWNQWPFVAEALFRAGIEPVFALSGVKNSADVRLAIECCQLALPNPAIQTLVIAGGDGDLVYLIHEAHRLGKRIVFLSLRDNLSPLLTRLANEIVVYEQFHSGYLAEAAERLPVAQQKERKKALQEAFTAVKKAVFELRRPDINGAYPVHDAAAFKRQLQENLPDFEEEQLGFERFRHFLFAAELRGLLLVDTKGEPGRQEYPVIYSPTETRNDRGEALLGPGLWKDLIQCFEDKASSSGAGSRQGKKEALLEEATLLQRFGKEVIAVALRSGFLRQVGKDQASYALTAGDERVIVYRAALRRGPTRNDTKKPASSSPPAAPKSQTASSLTQRPFEKLQK